MSIYTNPLDHKYTEETVLDEIYTELQQLRSDVDSLLEDREDREEISEKNINHTDWIYDTLKVLQNTVANKKSAFDISKGDMFVEHLVDPDIYVLQLYTTRYNCAINVKEQIKTIKDKIVPRELKSIIFIDIFLPSFFIRV